MLSHTPGCLSPLDSPFFYFPLYYPFTKSSSHSHNNPTISDSHLPSQYYLLLSHYILTPLQISHPNSTYPPPPKTLIPPTPTVERSGANRIVLKERSDRLCYEIPTAKRSFKGFHSTSDDKNDSIGAALPPPHEN